MSDSNLQPTEEELNMTKKLWWLHDSYWHATLVKALGAERANELNLEANERFFRKYTLMLLKNKKIRRPESIEDLMKIFRTLWKNCFFDNMYIDEPVVFQGNEAIWTGHQCNAFESLQAANMTKGYVCGCAALRNGVMKALRLKPVHSIEKSLVKGDGQCVIRFSFVPK